MRIEEDLNTIYVRLGKNIAYLRKSHDLTQEELAAVLNINSQALVSQYEHAKKVLSLERISDFCSFFGVSLEDMLFKDFSGVESKKNVDVSSQFTAPIQKCAGRTYYGYYLKEQNKGSSQFVSKITSFEIEVLQTELSHQAPVKLFLPNAKSDNGIDGSLCMDESYAYISCHDENTDFFLGLTFFYHRQRQSNKYVGGMALLQTLDYHILPVSQFCIVSSNAISSKRYSELRNLLELNTDMTKNNRLSKRVLSSNAILRLTKERDSLTFDWLKKNVNVML